MVALPEFIEANTINIQQQSRLREVGKRTEFLPQRRKDAKFGRINFLYFAPWRLGEKISETDSDLLNSSPLPDWGATIILMSPLGVAQGRLRRRISTCEWMIDEMFRFAQDDTQRLFGIVTPPVGGESLHKREPFGTS